MESYNRMRRELEMELKARNIDASSVLVAVDMVVRNYDISIRENTGNGMDVLQEFIACCEYQKLAAGTIENYWLVLSGLLRNVNMPIDSIRTTDIRTYMQKYQRERGVSDNTMNKYREYICGFWKWCCNEGYVQNNAASGLRKIKCEKKTREALTQTDLEYIRQGCRCARDRAMVEVLYSTGCRVSELCRLRKEDVDWNTKTVHLFGKGRKHRTSYLNAKAEIYLKAYLEERKDDCEFLFVTMRGKHEMSTAAVERIFRNLGNELAEKVKKPITPHIFRHTTATTALRGGMPIEDIQALLGHENIETTMVYAHTTEESVQANHKKYVV